MNKVTVDIEITKVYVTPLAAEKLRSLLQERDDPQCGLRVFVSGGGCSGMQYGMAFESNPREQDKVFESEGVKLIVDPTSLMYLGGARIDFVDSLMGGGFAIENPNAVSTCGCGHSFRTAKGGTAGGESKDFSAGMGGLGD
jgi:iron-sulfur cluster assembly accessory protein